MALSQNFLLKRPAIFFLLANERRSELERNKKKASDQTVLLIAAFLTVDSI
jgi:hypothetical protein